MKKRYMWGCRVTFDDGGEEWAWDTTCGLLACPYAFTDTRAGIMPLVKDWRSMCNVSRAVSVRVCLDDLLQRKD